MPEYPIPHLAEKFMALFQGNPDAYGRSQLTGSVNREGKHETRSWTVKEPTTKEVWIKHLNGEISIGQIPAREDGTVRWVAFDIDVYKGDLNVLEILANIDLLNLPIIICRSKSGGAHAVTFFREDVPMADIREKIQELATFFGVGGCEIFPKQDAISGTVADDNIRWGNWLNMPYDGPSSLRYGYTPDAQKLSPSEFVDLAEQRATTKEAFLAIELPRPEETLEDGPPCLNFLASERLDMRNGRNTFLFNLAIYFRKREPEATKEAIRDFVLEWNGKLADPLSEKEVRGTIVKSTANKEYRYQCGNPLLKRHCNSSQCVKCAFGIDGDENAFDPNNKTLIQLMTDPCLYFLNYMDTQITLTKEELWSYEKVRQACMVQARHIPPKMDQEHWLNLVQGFLQSVTVVELPPEATAVGQLIDILSNWKKVAVENKEALLNGSPAINKSSELVFRLQDLREMLKTRRFTAMEDNRIIEVLKNKLNMQPKFVRVGEKGVRCWAIDTRNLQPTNNIHISDIAEDEDNF